MSFTVTRGERAGDNLISHINHPFPARIVVSELDNVSSNPSHHEESQTHSVGRVLPAAFTGPLAGVEAVQVGVMESEVVLVDTAGHHPHVWELH